MISRLALNFFRKKKNIRTKFREIKNLFDGSTYLVNPTFRDVFRICFVKDVRPFSKRLCCVVKKLKNYVILVKKFCFASLESFVTLLLLFFFTQKLQNNATYIRIIGNFAETYLFFSILFDKYPKQWRKFTIFIEKYREQVRTCLGRSTTEFHGKRKTKNITNNNIFYPTHGFYIFYFLSGLSLERTAGRFLSNYLLIRTDYDRGPDGCCSRNNRLLSEIISG